MSDDNERSKVIEKPPANIGEDLVSLIYDTAFEPQLWPQLLETLSDRLKQDMLYTTAKEQEGQPSLDELSPHFDRAIQIGGRIYQMQAEHHVLRDFLNHFPIGVAIVQSNGEIVTLNDKAETLINGSPLLAISNKAIDFPQHPTHTTRLRRAIRQLSSGTLEQDSAGAFNTVRLTVKNQSVSLCITSIHDIANTVQKDFVAVLMTSVGTKSNLNTEAICRSHDLTEAECRLVLALLGGCNTLPEVAEELGLSVHTVRTQIKSVFEKMGVANQAGLLKKVFTSPEGLMRAGDRHAATTSPVLPDPGNVQPFHLITLQDGRHLEYAEFGRSDGTPLLYLHSTVRSRKRLHPFSSYVDDHAIRVIAPERPGYGRSEVPANTALKAYSNDIKQLLDHLGIERCHIVADGDGGPYALACATQLFDRIERMALIASMGPPQFDKVEKMVSLERLVHGMSRIAPIFAKHMVKMALWGLKKNPEKYFEKIYDEMHSSEQAVVDMPEHGTIFRESMEAITPENIDAYIEVYLARLSPWDFDIGEVSVPVDIWHGVEDRRASVAFAHTMHETLPNNRAFILENQGHYLFYTHWDQVLETLFSE